MGKLHAILLVLLLLSLVACKDTDPVEPDKEEVLANDGSFFQMEIAQVSFKNEKVGTGSITGKLNDEPIEIQLFDTAMVFVAPDIAPGVYNLEAPLGDKLIKGTIQIKEQTLSSSPDQIYEQIVTQNAESIQTLTEIAVSLSEEDKADFTKDVELIKGWLANLEQGYNNLSSDEKQKFAKTYASNQLWLDEVNTAIIELSADTKLLRTQSVIEDWEEKLDEAMGNYSISTIKLIKHVPKIAAMAATGAAFGSVIPGVGTSAGALIGGGIVIGKFLLSYMKHTAAMNKLMDITFLPFEEEFESQRIANTKVEFISKEAKEIETTTSYRSIYNEDNSSSIPVVNTFSESLSATNTILEVINPLLPESLQSPDALEDIESFSESKRAIHSNYLEISDISNDKVKLIEQERIDGRLLLTFENLSSTDEDFTYKVSYKNSRFSPGFSTTVNARIVSDLAGFLINNSPWNWTSLIMGGEEYFTLGTRGNTGCEGVLYDTRRKYLNGIISFSEEYANFEHTTETHAFNCDTRTYQVTEENDGFSQTWKIDGETGKFVLIEDGQEWAWLTAKIINDKVSFSGTSYVYTDGVRETSDFSFVIEK